MIDEPAIEAEDLVNSYVVTLEDEGDECCVVEDAERPMVLDVGNRVDTVNVELFQCLNEGLHQEKQAKKMDSGEETRRRRARPIMRFGCQALMTDYDPNNSFSESLSSPGMGLDAPVIVLTEDDETVGKMIFNFLNCINNVDEEDRLSRVFWVDTRSRVVCDCFSDVVAFDETESSFIWLFHDLALRQCWGNQVELGGDGGTTTYEVAKLDEEQKEAIKCVVGLATDHSFKVALNTLREARIKISGSKKNAISAQKRETVASNSFQDKNMISSHRDSHSLQTSHAGQKKANTAESSEGSIPENFTNEVSAFKYQSTSIKFKQLLSDNTPPN
ncbi:hypothetical protein OIU85_007649 [Salix viminalis]|uniref:Protein FAR1-RELATED SEQUENCE n=1 Tax=Salix viminalis TaxID=40686 RepID=A0A9Q0P9D7_SALVM|nr:hypothetical protein OIU85_007649 [Salix viminalis]